MNLPSVCTISILGVCLWSVPALGCEETKVDLSTVPQHVQRTALAAVSDIQLTEAEHIKTQSESFYEIEGEKDGEDYEIQVTDDGELLAVEQED